MIRIFRHYVPGKLLALALIEAAILFASVYIGAVLRFLAPDSGDVVHRVGGILPHAIGFTVIMFGTMTALGLFTRESQTGDLSYYMRFLGSFVVGVLALFVVFYAVPAIQIGRGWLVLTMAFAFVGTAITRILFLRVVDTAALRRRLLVLGTGTRAARVSALFEQNPDLGTKYRLVGYFMPGNSSHHTHIAPEQQVRDKGSLLGVTTKYGIDEIVVAVRDRRNSGVDMKELLECKLEGIQVTDISSFFERETGHVQLDSLNESWMVYSDGFQQTSARNTGKRVFDVAASLLLLLLTLPVTVLTALAIVIETGFPVFYRQDRVGECGRVFPVLKFRSMRQDAEQGGKPQWATKNDSRVTQVGRVIRVLRIDELPQIINVLRGEMSFVGPRPERPYFVRELAAQIPYFMSRHTVKPGITGWAQIRYPYGSSVEDAVRKLQYDLYYAKNHSMFLDVIILFQTVQVVLFGKGAR